MLRRITTLALFVLLTVTTLSMVSAPAQAAVSNQKPRLSASDREGVTGERIVLKGRIPGQAERRVIVQMKRQARWVKRSQARTNARGVFRAKVALPQKAGRVRYRVMAPKTKRGERTLRAVRTKATSVRVIVTPPTTPPAEPTRWLNLQNGLTTCGLKSDNSAWCWGRNGAGQVGDGTTTDRLTPYRIAGQWRWIKNSGRLNFSGQTCGIKVDDTAWCWGQNFNGHLGVSSTERVVPTPTQIPGRWKSIALGPYASCGIRTDDSGACWGAGGWTGDGTRNDQSGPVTIPGSWKSFQPGHLMCGFQRNDHLFCWGSDNEFGEVGNGSSDDVLSPYELRTEYQHPGPWVSAHNPQDFATRNSATCGIRPGNAVFCWGSNVDGEGGYDQTYNRYTPGRIEGDWTRLHTATSLTCGLRLDTSAWCWGGRATGTGVSSRVPVALEGRWSTLSLASTGEGVCGIRTDASLWCWGRGMATSGPVSEHQVTPFRLGNDTWREVKTATFDSMCGIRTDDVGSCWSRQVVNPLPGRWAEIYPSPLPYLTPACGIRTDGSGWCWGNNRYGQIGDGTTTSRSSDRMFRLP